jgi:hypothetical protein
MTGIRKVSFSGKRLTYGEHDPDEFDGQRGGAEVGEGPHGDFRTGPDHRGRPATGPGDAGGGQRWSGQDAARAELPPRRREAHLVAVQDQPDAERTEINRIDLREGRQVADTGSDRSAMAARRWAGVSPHDGEAR